MAMTAMDESQTQLWRVYIAFWDRAARDPFFAELQRTEIDLALKVIADVLRARNGDRADLQSISQRLNALVQGISILALAEKDRWPARAHPPHSSRTKSICCSAEPKPRGLA